VRTNLIRFDFIEVKRWLRFLDCTGIQRKTLKILFHIILEQLLLPRIQNRTALRQKNGQITRKFSQRRLGAARDLQIEITSLLLAFGEASHEFFGKGIAAAFRPWSLGTGNVRLLGLLTRCISAHRLRRSLSNNRIGFG
jgi:hypothetical protein